MAFAFQPFHLLSVSCKWNQTLQGLFLGRGDSEMYKLS